MKKLAIFIGALGALVVAAAVAAPYWTGQVAEEQFRALAEHSKARFGIETAIESFERDYAQSRAVTVTAIPTDEGAPVPLTIDHVIDHGPKIGQAALARVESSVRLPADTPDEVRMALGGEAPLRVVTLVQADGSYDIDASVPSFDATDGSDGTKVSFAGLTATGKIGANAQSFNVVADAPSLRVDSPDAKIDMDRLEYKIDMLAQPLPNIWTGPFEMTLAKFDARPTDKPPIALAGLALSGSVDTVDDGYGFNVNYAIDAIDVAGQAVRNFLMSFRIAKIDSQALSDYGGVAMNLNAQLSAAGAGDQAAMEEIQRQIAAAGVRILVTGNPTLHLDALNVDYGDGELRTNGKVRYTGGGDLSIFNPLADLDADIEVRASESMVLGVASEMLARRTYQRPPTELTAEEVETINGATRYQLAELMRTGMVSKGDDGSYSVRAVLERGGVLVNDAPTPFLPPPQ